MAVKLPEAVNVIPLVGRELKLNVPMVVTLTVMVMVLLAFNGTPTVVVPATEKLVQPPGAPAKLKTAVPPPLPALVTVTAMAQALVP